MSRANTGNDSIVMFLFDEKCVTMNSMMEYNEENLQKIAGIIKQNLTIDLLPKKWISKNLNNRMYGHCHNVSGCLYKIFGSEHLSMYRAFDGEIYHWWVQDKTGKIIDLTSEQYTSVGKLPPYDKAEKAGLLGFEYKRRVLKLYDRVISKLNEKKLGVFNYYE